MHINEEVYNYDALNKECKKVIDHMRWVKEDVIDAFVAEVEFEAEDEGILEKIKAEIMMEAVERMNDLYQMAELEMIVAMLDNEAEEKNDEEVVI